MILYQKNAIVYGAGGSLGSSVSKSLAHAGAKIFLCGRNVGPLQKVADEIKAFGGQCEISVVDALVPAEVHDHIQNLVERGIAIDISFNAIDLQVVQNIPLVDMKPEDFTRPVLIAMQTHFLTATAVAKVMMKRGAGVILSLTATSGGIGYAFTGAFLPHVRQ